MLTQTGSAIKQEHQCPIGVEHDRFLEEKALELQTEKEDRTWESCCFRTDRRACQFVVQSTIAFAVLAFSAVQLVRYQDCESIQPYLSMIVFILGSFCRDVAANNKTQ